MDRREFFNLLNKHVSIEDLKKIGIAYQLSKDAHRKQTRDTGERYFEHPRSVAEIIIRECEIYDPATITVALLHDTFEDTFLHPYLIQIVFGDTVYKHLLNLSKYIPVFDDLTGEMLGRVKKENYYRGIAEGRPSVIITKGADRVHNLRTFGAWEPARRAKYLKETEEKIIPIVERCNPILTGILKDLVRENRTLLDREFLKA